MLADAPCVFDSLVVVFTVGLGINRMHSTITNAVRNPVYYKKRNGSTPRNLNRKQTNALSLPVAILVIHIINWVKQAVKGAYHTHLAYAGARTPKMCVFCASVKAAGIVGRTHTHP